MNINHREQMIEMSRIGVVLPSAQNPHDDDIGEMADAASMRNDADAEAEEETRKKSAEEINKDHEYIRRMLRNFSWYHGFLIREELIHVLKVPNSFLVRRSPGNFTDVFCISILRDRISNYVILWNDKPAGWHSPKLFEKDHLKPQIFPHIHLLIDFWVLKKLTIAVPRAKNNNIIEEEHVSCDKLICSGNNGDVYMGFVKLNGTPKDCAIRKIKLNAARRVKRNFFWEIRLLSSLDNENVLKCYGQSTVLPPMMSFFELALSGTLEEYMRETKSVSNEIKFGFVLDISRGMSYLSSQKVIHRDLSATNCMIGAHLICKVGNFKNAIQAVEMSETWLRSSRMRWASPETISTGIYNQKTDVWSFGVVIWQIYTCCRSLPLANLAKTSKDIRTVVRSVEYPHQLDGKKDGNVQQILMNCHEKKPENRQNFGEIVRKCRIIMKEIRRCEGKKCRRFQSEPSLAPLKK